MLPYFMLLMVPAVFSLVNTRKLSLSLWAFTFITYVLFAGLRDEVGPDWVQYGYIHSTIVNEEFWDVATQVEPLSYLLFWASENLGYHVYFSNVVAATIMMTGVFCFARRTANPWLAVVTATPYFVIVMGMSGVRQVMAAGVVLFLFSRWEKYSFIKRFLYILVAALFHTSALVNNIFLIIKLNIALRYKVVLGVLIFLLTVYLSFAVSMYSENVVKYQQRYLEKSFLEESFGSLYHIAMIAIPAFLGFIFKKRFIGYIHNTSLLYFGLYASVIILVVNFFSSTAASRLTVYLYFVPMMVYPALTASFGRRAQLVGVVLVVGFHLLIMWAWFMFGNHAFAYVPYKNVMFE